MINDIRINNSLNKTEQNVPRPRGEQRKRLLSFYNWPKYENDTWQSTKTSRPVAA